MLHSRIFPFNPLETNCVVLWRDGSKKCVVTDPGMSSPENLEELTGFLKAEGLTPEAILLTHGHFDHVWGVEKLCAAFPGIKVYEHPLDKDIMERITTGRFAEGFNFLKHDFPTEDVIDGETLTLAGITLQVMHTPGHSPGSVCYYVKEDNLLLSGDTLFAGSIGRTDLTGGDYDVLMDSLLHKVMVLPGDTDVIPGHGHPTTIGREGMTNPFLEPFNDPLPED
ncbi:MAG: MBL fold metallo-hydrolase [Bacteroidales bacterium]|nr:MBL fold metallo-hydrolase [Bacteroidales bacterium]